MCVCVCVCVVCLVAGEYSDEGLWMAEVLIKLTSGKIKELNVNNKTSKDCFLKKCFTHTETYKNTCHNCEKYELRPKQMAFMPP